MIDMNARYSVATMPGVAFYLKGYATRQEPIMILDYDEDDQKEYRVESGDYEEVEVDDEVIAIMVGDDREFVVDVEDLILISDEDYCSGCGQIGCAHGRIES